MRQRKVPQQGRMLEQEDRHIHDTRRCLYPFMQVLCDQTGKPLPPEQGEPEEVAESIRLMGLKHAVLTSVDRDDLPDGGAGHWAETIRAIRRVNPDTTIEVLIPDFDCRKELLDIVIDEAGAYFAGDKSAEDACAIIQNRVDTYIAEQFG